MCVQQWRPLHMQWCLLPVVLNAVPIHTQCCDHYLRDEASWLMALAISSNKHHTHKHTHTSSHETRGNQRVVLPPAKPPSLLLTAPPRSPTNPYPIHPATSPPPPQVPPPPCGMPAAVCLKEALCARRKTHSCAAEPSSNVCIVTLGPEWSPGTGGLPGPASATFVSRGT